MKDGNKKRNGGNNAYYGNQNQNQNQNNNSYYGRNDNNHGGSQHERNTNNWNQQHNNDRTPFSNTQEQHHQRTGGGTNRQYGYGGRGGYSGRGSGRGSGPHQNWNSNDQYARPTNNNNNISNSDNQRNERTDGLAAETNTNQERSKVDRKHHDDDDRRKEEAKRLKGVNKETWDEFTLPEQIQSQVSTCCSSVHYHTILYQIQRYWNLFSRKIKTRFPFLTPHISYTSSKNLYISMNMTLMIIIIDVTSLKTHPIGLNEKKMQ